MKPDFYVIVTAVPGIPLAYFLTDGYFAPYKPDQNMMIGEKVVATFGNIETAKMVIAQQKLEHMAMPSPFNLEN